MFVPGPRSGNFFFSTRTDRYSNNSFFLLEQLQFNVDYDFNTICFLFIVFTFTWIKIIYQVVCQTFLFHYFCCKWFRVHFRESCSVNLEKYPSNFSTWVKVQCFVLPLVFAGLYLQKRWFLMKLQSSRLSKVAGMYLLRIHFNPIWPGGDESSPLHMKNVITFERLINGIDLKFHNFS